MKRRVLRTHNNKKVLRTVQAAHQLKDTAHHVICDETFLRSVIGRGADSVRDLVADCLGSCVLHVLPETLRNLERHQHVKALDQASSECLILDDRGTAGDQGQERGDPIKASPRNELKAIAATVRNALPNKFYFVASQSHDLRALLPDDAAILRATFEPVAVWLECNKSNDNHKHPAKPKKAALSPADAAFMNSLGLGKKKKQVRRQDNTIKKSVPVGDVGVQDKAVAEGGVSAATVPAAPRVRRPHAKTIKGPNPLSMKKKTLRETFSIAQTEPPKNKRRTEFNGNTAAH